MRIEGLKQLERKLKALPDRVAKRVVGGAVRAGLRLIAKVTKQQVDDPEFKRAVGSDYRRTGRKAGGRAGVNVGKKGSRKVPHFSLWTMGTRPRYTKSGAYRGRMPANPVVDEAVAISESQALDVTVKNLKAGLEREAKR